MLTKKQIRSKILLKLKTQKEEERERRSGIIKEKLFKSAVFKKAKVVMFYISFNGEVNTREMIRQANNLGKIVTVPVCAEAEIIRPGRLSNNDALAAGPYGIREPLIKRFIDSRNLSLVIVPGVAFDKKGNRLGRGKGYYDRFLAKLPKKAQTIGLAFDFQILPCLPIAKTDVSVKRVIFA